MDQLPATWPALCTLAFVLGARHGFDADHLATIDGLARYNSRSNPRLGSLAGALFSLGHGAIVLLVALAAATLSSAWHTPAWLETSVNLIREGRTDELDFDNLSEFLESMAAGSVARSPAAAEWRCRRS